MGQHGSAGEDLDMVSAVMHQLTDSLPHFPRTVCLSVTKIPRQRDVRSQAGHGARATRDGYISSGHIHARAFDKTMSDRISHGDIVQRPINSHVAHRGEPL